MPHHLSNSILEAYLDEALPAEEMVRVETALRDDAELIGRLGRINSRRDAGVHTLGEIWRRHRLSCLTREQLGSYLLGVLPPEAAAFVRLHVETPGCRLCAANLADLAAQQSESAAAAGTRRRKYFESSAGYLRERK